MKHIVKPKVFLLHSDFNKEILFYINIYNSFQMLIFFVLLKIYLNNYTQILNKFV